MCEIGSLTIGHILDSEVDSELWLGLDSLIIGDKLGYEVDSGLWVLTTCVLVNLWPSIKNSNFMHSYRG